MGVKKEMSCNEAVYKIQYGVDEKCRRIRGDGAKKLTFVVVKAEDSDDCLLAKSGWFCVLGAERGRTIGAGLQRRDFVGN